MLLAASGWAQDAAPDRTCFQTGGGYTPEIDVATDMAIVYGSRGDFLERVKSWRDQGYTIGFMTGIAWGGYEDYFGTGETFKKDEVQTRKDGSLWMHGGGGEVGYNVPTAPYIEYMKQRVEPAVDAGAVAVFLEEPEYWATAGWSESFKKEWQAFYGEPWQAPDSSPDAQYRASKLKYELYFRALKEVFAHTKARAKERGAPVLCAVPTHSLINYAHWRIVSPESHLMDLPDCDGYIAQVWTGTARTPNVYAGVKKERTFETAFFEYGQMLSMVRPTGRRVWFLHDPIEDNPNHSWNDYKKNYECTVVASLMWPDVSDFEVMPWPNRIFAGKYPKADMDTKSGEVEGIPPDYATEVLAIINALNEMKQREVVYDTGTRGIGIFVSDTLMFQRAEPEPSDPDMSFFYGLALPLLKAGVPVEPVQLENTLEPKTLEPYRVLLLSYRGQKPLKPEYHEALSAWVQAGGALLVVDDGRDPYNGVREWWNDQGRSQGTPLEHLYNTLDATPEAREGAQRVGEGFVRIVETDPGTLAASPEGAEHVRALVRELLKAQGSDLTTRNYLKVQRGPFVVASVLDESVSDEPLRLRGSFIDVFNPELPVLNERVLAPNERTLLYDFAWAWKQGLQAKVLAASARIRDERLEGETFTFTARGPMGTRANARVLLPREPKEVTTDPSLEVKREWDAESSTLWLSFDNIAAPVTFKLAL
jgi:hypothetical protein